MENFSKGETNKKKKGKKPKNKEQDYDEKLLTKIAESNLNNSANEKKDDDDDEVLDVDRDVFRKQEDVDREQEEIKRKEMLKEKKIKSKIKEDDFQKQNNENKQEDSYFNLYNFLDKFDYLSNQPLFYLLENKCPYNKYANALSIDNLFEMFKKGKINKKTMKVKLIDLFTYDKKYEFFPISKVTKPDWANKVEYSNIFNERKANKKFNIMVDDFMLKDFNEILKLPEKEKKEKLSEKLNNIYNQYVNK